MTKQELVEAGADILNNIAAWRLSVDMQVKIARAYAELAKSAEDAPVQFEE